MERARIAVLVNKNFEMDGVAAALVNSEIRASALQFPTSCHIPPYIETQVDLVLQARAEQVVGVGCDAICGNGLLAHALVPDCKETALSVVKTGRFGTHEKHQWRYTSCAR